MKKKILIHNGNISIGGQEKMLIEFLKILDSTKYEILLLIEENNGVKNEYLNEIPKWIEYKFLTTEKFMNKIEKYKNKKNVFSKLYYSFLLKKKKNIAINNLKKYLDFSNIIIDYDMGLIRNLHKLDLTNKKLIGWSHAGSGGKQKSKKKNQNMEKYDYIVAINDIMKKGYEKNYPNIKIKKIYNFMDLDLITEKSKEKMEENFGKYIISVGSLTKNKNHSMLIKAFKILKEKYSIEEKLLIVGDGKEKENLEDLIKNLNLENEVYLLGQKSNPYKYIANSELFILPSINEGFSLTIIEAMNLNKMVIATENNGALEILKSDEYGKIIKIDIQDMVENILYFLKNKSERQQYESKDFIRIQDFGKDAGKKNIEEFIDKI